MLKALDLSNYSGEINKDHTDCWKATGISKVIVGTQSPKIAQQQLYTLTDAGIAVETYVYLRFDRDTKKQAQDAVNIGAPFRPGRLWLDCEDEHGALDPQALEGRIWDAIHGAAGTPCGIYTGRWWWEKYKLSNTFAGMPLWHAEYALISGVKPAEVYLPNFDEFQPYGGWTRPAMWQYAGSVLECGVNVDLNAYEGAAAPTVVDSPPAAQDIIYALVSAAEFTRRGWQLKDLIEPDKAAIRYVASLL